MFIMNINLPFLENRLRFKVEAINELHVPSHSCPAYLR